MTNDTNLKATVTEWAMVYAPRAYWYGSARQYCGAALSAGVITEEEFKACRAMYGDLWHFISD